MAGRLRTEALIPYGRARLRAAQEEVRALASRPRFSVVMPTYETEPRHLREAIESVRRQRYPEWELCIADDGSRRAKTHRMLERYQRADERIQVTFLEQNQGIAAATNAALALATGDFVALLDHDDVLSSDALLRVAQALDADPQLDVVYSDSDKLTLRGTREDPFFKPDWSPTYALGAMFIGHLLVVRRSIAQEVGGFDSAYDKIQDFEFILRVVERTDRIHHIPLILYHWRAVPGSIALGAEEKSGVPELQAKAVTAHLHRTGVEAAAVPHEAIPHRARIVAGPKGEADAERIAARVSLIVPWRGNTRNLRRLLDSVYAVSDQPPGEVIVVGAKRPEQGHPVHAVDYSEPTFSRPRALNLGAEAAGGEWLVFAADTSEVTEPGWLYDLLAHAALPWVGAVGPLLARPDGRVEAAGFAIGLDHPIVPMLAGLDATADGYYGALACARDVSLVSAEFMLVRASVFKSLGGFDEHYASGFEDFDLCQRLRRIGLGTVYAPRPRVVVHELPATRREAFDPVDRALFVDRWYHELERGDPFFNPNFARRDASFAPA